MAFDCVQVKFKNTKFWESPRANTRVVPFIDSYFDILKKVVNDVIFGLSCDVQDTFIF